MTVRVVTLLPVPRKFVPIHTYLPLSSKLIFNNVSDGLTSVPPLYFVCKESMSCKDPEASVFHATAVRFGTEVISHSKVTFSP